MAFIGRFFGVNRHKSSKIRDLTGAVQDASALCALFKDNVPDIQAELIIDQQATHERLNQELKELVLNSKEDDVLVLSFSGHGSPDHRLVAYDSSIDDIAATTLAMKDIANAFRMSKARAILFILDCCFAGDAASKVLDSAPIPRSSDSPFEPFEGKGRILIAAAHYNEPAWELPSTGHGILTKAVLDTFLNQEKDFDISTAIAGILEMVRGEAAKIGRIQTPLSVGIIEGGLKFPRFSKGSEYLRLFPNRADLKASADLSSLYAYGIPDLCIEQWKKTIPNLNSLQLRAINDFGVLNSHSLFVIAPTSAGKTFVGELAAIKAIHEGKKAAFLLPYKALVNEKFFTFDTLYGDGLGMRVIRCSGDYTDQIGEFLKGKFEIALFTYEMFLSVATSSPTALEQVGLVVIDEAQFITDPRRGIAVELILTLMKSRQKRGIECQMIALSAVVGDLNHFDEWLDMKTLITTERPVPLKEGVIDRTGVVSWCVDGKELEERVLPPGLVIQRKREPSSQDLLVPLVKKLNETDKKIIVFRNMRGPARGCARYLGLELGLAGDATALSRLPNHDISGTTEELRQCLATGTAFHNTDLSPLEKDIVETAFRNSDSNVRVLASTTTLAAGINTPASTVLLAEMEFVGGDSRPFTVAEYKNMAGRAGRLGFNEDGKSLILAETPYQRKQLFNKYVKGTVESISSSFDSGEIDNWVLRLLTQVQKIDAKAMVSVLLSTYGGYLEARLHPSWAKNLEADLGQLIDRMTRLGLLESEGDFVRLSLLGRTCGSSSLPLGSSMALVEILRQNSRVTLNPIKLMAILQFLPDSDIGYIPLFKKGVKDQVWISNASDLFGSDVVRALQRGASDNYVYASRCKKACLLADWISGVDISDLERNYSITPFSAVGRGDVTRVADGTRYHLGSALNIALIINPGADLPADEIDELLKQLQVGLPKSCLDLLNLPFGLARGEYLALNARGICTVVDFWARSETELTSILGDNRYPLFSRFRPATTG